MSPSQKRYLTISFNSAVPIGICFFSCALKYRPKVQNVPTCFLPAVRAMWSMYGHESFRLHAETQNLAACQISSELVSKYGNYIEKTYWNFWFQFYAEMRQGRKCIFIYTILSVYAHFSWYVRPIIMCLWWNCLLTWACQMMVGLTYHEISIMRY